MSANTLETASVGLPSISAPRAWYGLGDTAWGVLSAMTSALIFASTIAFSRLAIKTTLAPVDLIALRFGIGGLLFLPFLFLAWRTLPAVARRAGLPMSFSHGWGMVGCSLIGLGFAPASHAAALGPGCVPLFIAAIAPFALGRGLSRQQQIGLSAILLGGAALFVQASYGSSSTALIGDGLFVVAAFLAACYLVFVERYKVPALAGNAVVMVFSAVIVLPVYLIGFESRLLTAPMHDVAIQALFQGFLMSLAYFLTHFAVLKIGGARVSMIMASIPVITLLMAHSIAGDPIRPLEVFAVLAICCGIVYGALLKLRRVADTAGGVRT